MNAENRASLGSDNLFPGVYYSLTLAVTTSVTVTEVMVLELHFRSQYGDPLPQKLVKIAKWMAAMTFTKLDINIPEKTGVDF